MASLEPVRINITLFGDGGTGKSSITLRLVRSVWTSTYDPTIEDSYTISRTIDGRPYLLSLTDTAGQEEYRGMWAGANMLSDAFLLVYDITSRDSLDALGEFVELVDMESDTRQEANSAIIQRVKKDNQKRSTRGKSGGARREGGGLEQEIKPLPVKIIAGNKCDLQESRQVDAKTGLEWARGRGCGFMETSARNVVNIEETFALIVRRVMEARRIAAQQVQQLQGPTPAPLGAPGGGLNSNSNAYAGGGMGGNRALPPQGLDFSLGRGGQDAQGQNLGTRRAMTAPLTPLPVTEEKAAANGFGRGNGDGRRWNFRGPVQGPKKWKGLLCF